MNPAIRILHLEDIRSDAEVIHLELIRSKLNYERLWVTNRKDFLDALTTFQPHVILSDHSLPDISSVEAFQLTKQMPHHIPFILVTATVSEEFAVSMIKEGVTDYVLKDRLQRLPQAIKNAIELANTELQEELHYQQIVSQERKFRALIENISDAIVMLDKNGEFIYQSASATRITGFSIEEFSTLNIIDFLPKPAKQEAKAFLKELLQNKGNRKQAIFRIKHKAGHHIWIESSFTNLLHDENINALIMNFRDITERKKAEQQRERSEAKLQTIFNNTKVAYVLIDSDFNVMSFNPLAKSRYKREIGVELEEKFNFLPYLKSLEDNNSLINFQNVLNGQKIQYEKAFVQADGVKCWYSVNMFPVTSQDEQTMGFIIASEDITDRKLSELDREKMTTDLLHHVKDLEQFAYIVSHNLRSPVANIRGLSNLLHEESGLSESDFLKCLDGLLEAANKLDDVITDLNFILQTRRDVDERKEVVNIETTLDSIETSLSEQLTKQKARIEKHLQVSEIFTLKSYIHSILINLIANAIKYRRPNTAPIITIKTERQGENIYISISDNGMGIDLEKHGAKLFGLYKKFHQHIEGKGMGLYMVKTQVEILGGTIEVKSTLNVGTCFTIRL
jgi:PAS domain S-box-containing protein